MNSGGTRHGGVVEDDGRFLVVALFVSCSFFCSSVTFFSFGGGCEALVPLALQLREDEGRGGVEGAQRRLPAARAAAACWRACRCPGAVRNRPRGPPSPAAAAAACTPASASSKQRFTAHPYSSRSTSGFTMAGSSAVLSAR